MDTRELSEDLNQVQDLQELLQKIENPMNISTDNID